MKLLSWFIRLFTGALFIVSGLVKLNDPMGFSFKLEEYFSPGVFDMVWLEPMALTLSLLIIISEVFLGVMLILGYGKKFCLYSLLGMVVFFAFLTFYSAFYDKVTDCGCFGDALKLTPWQSFWKDIILLVFVVFLIWQRQKINPIINSRFSVCVLSGTLVCCSAIAVFVLRHLPIIDFRPYKVGVNIYDDMRVPTGVAKNVYEYTWTFEHKGKTKEVVTKGDYPDEKGKMIGVKTNLITKGYEPPIHDFSIEDSDGRDLTAEMLSEPYLAVFVFRFRDIDRASEDDFTKIKTLSNKMHHKAYKVIALTASSPEENTRIKIKFGLDFNMYFTDSTILKTIIRANPGLVMLHQGVIVQKLHYNDFDSVLLQ